MDSYLSSCIKQFRYYEQLGRTSIERLSIEQLHWTSITNNNSISIIVRHLAGNMKSRWTDFLSTDGEKAFRHRDTEFIQPEMNKSEILQLWDEGWNILFHTIEQLETERLEQIIYIRNQGHTVIEAINRQLCHYAYHIGQIVFIARLLIGEEWQSLSIPPGLSETFNKQKFSKEKSKGHFTDDFIK